MKNLVLLSIFMAFSLSAYALDDSCMTGDCVNEYGSYYNQKENVVYHGFYETGIYNGVGYHQNSKGYYYLSEFKNGVPNGYTVYDEGGNRTSGLFIEGVKSGPHIRVIENGKTFSREVINYAKGMLIDRKKFTTSASESGPCLAGECSNGFGILNTQGMLLIGIFKDNRMLYGEFMQLSSQSSEFFIMPTQKTMSAPYFKVSLHPQENSIQEIAAIYTGRQLNGEYVVVDATTGQTGGAIFKNDQVVKKY